MNEVNIDNRVVFNFASLIYKDVQKYIAEHQDEYNEWLEDEGKEDLQKNN